MHTPTNKDSTKNALICAYPYRVSDTEGRAALYEVGKLNMCHIPAGIKDKNPAVKNVLDIEAAITFLANGSNILLSNTRFQSRTPYNFVSPLKKPTSPLYQVSDKRGAAAACEVIKLNRFGISAGIKDGMPAVYNSSEVMAAKVFLERASDILTLNDRAKWRAFNE
jgi:hypothetical protein